MYWAPTASISPFLIRDGAFSRSFSHTPRSPLQTVGNEGTDRLNVHISALMFGYRNIRSPGLQSVAWRSTPSCISCHWPRGSGQAADGECRVPRRLDHSIPRCAGNGRAQVIQRSSVWPGPFHVTDTLRSTVSPSLAISNVCAIRQSPSAVWRTNRRLSRSRCSRDDVSLAAAPTVPASLMDQMCSYRL
jgi:hypothetical protein